MSEPKPTFDSRGDIGATDPARGSHVSRKTAGRSRGGAGGWLDFSQAPKILWFIIKPTKLTIKIRTATCTGICIYIILYIYIHIYVDTCTWWRFRLSTTWSVDPYRAPNHKNAQQIWPSFGPWIPTLRMYPLVMTNIAMV
jgi:hypothetical protein